jgi:hypothetical protein
MSRPIAYEPHPVTPERKAELIGQGFKIIDAAFRPADEPAAVAAPASASKRASKRAADAAITDQQEA